MSRPKTQPHSFSSRVRAVVAAIPRGKTMSYAEVAAASGSPRACRAVGNILNKNYGASVPCHRVVRADGTPGGYNRGAARKERLLMREHAL